MAKKNKKETELKQYHLSGKNPYGYSGRGIRMRVLTPDEINDIDIEVAKDLSFGEDPKLNNIMYSSKRSDAIAFASLHSVTVEKSLTKEQLSTAKWHEITDQEKADPESGWQVDDLFTVKDSSILSRIVRAEYDVDAEDAASIINLAVPVSMED